MTLDLELTKDQGSFLCLCTLRKGRLFIFSRNLPNSGYKISHALSSNRSFPLVIPFSPEPKASWAASFPPASGHATALVALPLLPLRSQNQFSADRSGSGSGCGATSYPHSPGSPWFSLQGNSNPSPARCRRRQTVGLRLP